MNKYLKINWINKIKYFNNKAHNKMINKWSLKYFKPLKKNQFYNKRVYLIHNRI